MRKRITALSSLSFIILIFISLPFLYGCSSKPKPVKDDAEGTIVIPAVFLIDPATDLSENKEFIESFNAEYEGQFYVDVKWLTESAGGYREKLKQWNVLDEMPAIITDAGFDYDFCRLLVENGRLVNLKPYMEDSPEWTAAIKPEIFAQCAEESGDIYLSPLGSEVQSYAGIIYNKELLQKVGYETFPENWEDFWKCLDALAVNGITPLSLHGSGSYWVSMLMATSWMQSGQEGKEFLSRDFPDSYQNESMEGLLEVLKRLFGYTYTDAVDIDYDRAAERFCDGEAAIFANGYWMFQSMPEEAKAKMGFAPFPGNVLMNSPRMSAWAVTSGYDEDVTEGAVRLLEYRVMQDAENTEKLRNQKNQGGLKQSYMEAVQHVGFVMPNYQMKWEQEIQNDFFTEYLPEYLDNEIDAKQFLAEMDRRLALIRAKK